MGNDTACTVIEGGERCTSAAVKRKMCNKHYLRTYRHGSPLANAAPKRASEEVSGLIRKAAYADTEECIILLDASGKRQQVKWGGMSMFASRAAWIERYGDPGDALVLHTCNGGSGASGCININHLRVGTPDENSKDMVNSEQQGWGERARHAKLTEDQVLEICRRYKRYDPTNNGNALAREFGVSRATITAIVSGKTWKPLPRD